MKRFEGVMMAMLLAYVRFEQERSNIRRDAQAAIRRAADRMTGLVLDELATYYGAAVADTSPPPAPPSGASVN